MSDFVSHGLYYIVHGILQARILEWVAFPFARGSSQLRNESNPDLLHCRRILYQLSHQGTPRILDGEFSRHIFPTQESNWGLLLCRQILCQLSYLMLSCFSRVQLFVALWTVARQAPLSMGFSRQDTGVSCHFLLQGKFLTQRWNPWFSHLPHW